MVKKAQSGSGKKGRFFSALCVLCLVITGAIFVAKSFKPTIMQRAKSTRGAMYAQAKPLTPQPSPTIIPTNTPFPSPTIAYTGFCITVPVLMYHHIEPIAVANAAGHGSLTVDPTIFDQQMQYLSAHYHTITADDLAHSLLSQVKPDHAAIVITFDDGYADNYTYAYPTLKKYGLTGNLFLSTGLVGNPDYMTWASIKDVSDSGTVHVYNHTWSHYSLPKGDLTKINYEITTARDQIKQYLGKSDDGIFAYPYGANDSKSVAALTSKGYSAAYSTLPGTIQCDSFIMALHRTRIGNAPLASYGL